ncbi:MAG: hypothetical protein OXT69_11365 [Candidatus Poribacteria bacterium]|nr:hypothetical protein [Candidatus Poribacteria bacterium]
MRTQKDNLDFDIAPPYKVALQAHRFEWILRFERLSLDGYPCIHGSMSIAALDAERRAENVERPPLGCDPAGWALKAADRAKEVGGRQLLEPTPIAAPFIAPSGGLVQLSEFLDSHVAQLVEEPWRSDVFMGGDFIRGGISFRVRASHSLGIASSTGGCFELQVTCFLSPFFDPLGVSVEGRVNIAECVAFSKQLRDFRKAYCATLFKQRYPGKRPSDLDDAMEESLRKATRKMIQNPGLTGHPLWKHMTQQELQKKFGIKYANKISNKVYWFPKHVWFEARFDLLGNAYKKWRDSIVRSEKGEDVEVLSAPPYIDDAEFVGEGVLPTLKLVPRPSEQSD